MQQNSSQCSFNPSVMEDEHVSFERGPCHQHADDHIDAAIDEHPDATEGWSGREYPSSEIEMQIPDDVGHLVEQAERIHEDDDMIVDRQACFSSAEQLREKKDGAEDGWDEWNEIAPESEKLWFNHG